MKIDPVLLPEERLFLQQMIEHHQMALAMAKDVLRISNDNDIVSIAFSILQTQSNEIAFMREMLQIRK
jgi:uncharacterized protein (DUF305 family)